MDWSRTIVRHRIAQEKRIALYPVNADLPDAVLRIRGEDVNPFWDVLLSQLKSMFEGRFLIANQDVVALKHKFCPAADLVGIVLPIKPCGDNSPTSLQALNVRHAPKYNFKWMQNAQARRK